MNSQPVRLPATDGKELLRWIFRRRKLYRVRGNSMLPHLAPGDVVLAVPVGNMKTNFQEGDIVVMPHPSSPRVNIIKRIAVINPDRSLDLVGDNPAESTNYLDINPEKIIGVVTSKFP